MDSSVLHPGLTGRSPLRIRLLPRWDRRPPLKVIGGWRSHRQDRPNTPGSAVGHFPLMPYCASHD